MNAKRCPPPDGRHPAMADNGNITIYGSALPGRYDTPYKIITRKLDN